MNALHVAMLFVIASTAYADQNPSLATVLAPDGRIMEGASGSFDPEGFRMTYGPDWEPLFVAEAFLSGEPAPFSGGQYDAGTWHPLGTLPAGSQTHYWNGQGGNGQALAQGVYFVRLSSD